jgi:hypothetical protein
MFSLFYSSQQKEIKIKLENFSTNEFYMENVESTRLGKFPTYFNLILVFKSQSPSLLQNVTSELPLTFNVFPPGFSQNTDNVPFSKTFIEPKIKLRQICVHLFTNF